MITYDRARVRRAVQFLVDSSYFTHHVTKLRTSVSRPRAMPFKDGAECLNELLVVGRQSLQAMENLIEVAETKRGGRNEYQKNYMAAKRRRDRKVIVLAELMAGKPLTTEDRVSAVATQYKAWNKDKDRMLAGMEAATWLEKNERTREFWARKEAEIDALILKARERGPVKRRYKVDVPPPPPSTVFGKKLLEVIKPPKPKAFDTTR